MNLSQIKHNSQNLNWQSELGVHDNEIFQKIWDQAKACGRLGPENPVKGLRETLVYSGQGIEVEGASSDPKIHAVVQYLLGRGDRISEGAVDRNLCKAVFVEEDRVQVARPQRVANRERESEFPQTSVRPIATVE